MTTLNMQPGERDAVTDVLSGVVLGLTFGLVDLTTDDPERPGPTTSRSGPGLVSRDDEDRELGG